MLYSDLRLREKSGNMTQLQTKIFSEKFTKIDPTFK